MFRRLFFDDWVSLFPFIAFIVAATIFLTIAYRALRMRRGQVEHFENLPFNDQPSPAPHHEPR